jgi:hypothetical protein
MTIYHMHHIIPKHMGGTDDSSNLIRLTVEEHAQAHLDLFQNHGKIEDFIAYKALSKQINISDASYLAWIIGSYKGGYAKKPNSKSAYNKTEYYCVGCRKRVKPSAIMKGHILCFQQKYDIPRTQNSSYKTSEDGKKMAMKNNNKVKCDYCEKEGQYRAMKRWHFENCHLKP